MGFAKWIAGLPALFARSRPGAGDVSSAVAPSAAPGRYVDHLGRELPGAAGAWRRVEEEAVAPGLTETRYYRQGVEWLQRRVRQGVDAAGQPYLLRVTYWPWGQESVWLEKSVRDGQACVEYRRFFGDGELQEHKVLVGRQLRTDYVFGSAGGPYTYVEAMPVYPGGPGQLLQDVSRLVKYPAVSLRNRQEGRVLLSFTLRPDGLLGNVRVQQGVTPELDAAAVQVLRDLRSRRWWPGFQNHRPVPVVYSIPITFSIR